MVINSETLSTRILKSRFAQIIINENIKAKLFNIPIHLALGHEAISEAVAAVMQSDDKLLCSHRNIHYQLARGAVLFDILEEFKLSDKGLSNGKQGSMNLTNPKGSIVYTSNILGNNLCVGTGVALSKRIKQENGIVFVVTGDGAIEEGAFYETIENGRNMNLPLIILVENNNWSLASKIEERRKPINLEQLSLSLGAEYTFLEGNNPMHYYHEILSVKNRVSLQRIPEIVEVKLTTLGGWTIQTEDFPDEKYINYHAGPAPKISLNDGPILNFDDSDPVYLIKENLGKYKFECLIKSIKLLFSDYLLI
ncbi:AcoA Pyruvate/2-oxoglutarate dehydrogenase complex, dehydrogenase (E1) component, eukaryotic type, alpha subunit [Candidatus Methylopumilus universalis]|uniref:thiamine pyrophosphate-dependent enzyme n=1 Tax=Candidatus Methylopumilus universalis TaxID=2588536 RepID=UPI003BEF33A3